MENTDIKISPVNISKRAKLDLRAGDTVRVWSKVQEKGKTRLQAFEGLVLCRKHGAEPGATFTVRRTASGVGVERIYPLYSPNIDKIEIVKRSKVRRSKLYYIREKVAREIRRKMRNFGILPKHMLDSDDEETMEKEKEVVEEKMEESGEDKENKDENKNEEKREETSPEKSEEKEEEKSEEKEKEIGTKEEEEKK